jgi:protein transport protein SEC24
MLVVSDLEEAYLPRPDDLLVNLSEFRRSVEALLSRLPTIFGDSAHTSGGATGPALYGALALLVSPLKTNINRSQNLFEGGIGGKIVLLSASMSALGEGALDMTENAHWHDTQKVCS